MSIARSEPGSPTLLLLLTADCTSAYLTFTSDDAEYLAKGNDSDELVEVWDGQQYEEVPRSTVVTLAQARVAVQEFMSSGARTPLLEWELVCSGPVKPVDGSFFKAIIKAGRPPPKPAEFIELDQAILCPHCQTASNRFRKIHRGWVCLSCSRSFAPSGAS